MVKSKSVQLQYQGFLDTPLLWVNTTIKGLNQFNIPHTKTFIFNETNSQNLRLGKWIERFVIFQCKQDSTIEIVAENIQIQKEKITQGELDCILLKDNQPIHLEIVYKFYLYDKNIGDTEIEHWIGPNKKDSFLDKVEKLANKQLPLLHSPFTKPYLSKLKLSSKHITQQVYFKAQLFVPWQDYGNTFSLINNSCIVGFYLNMMQLYKFSNAKFYIPKKHDWLIIPHKNVDWFTYKNFDNKIMEYMNDKKSPLCWIKKGNGELHKVFVVWW